MKKKEKEKKKEEEDEKLKNINKAEIWYIFDKHCTHLGYRDVHRRQKDGCQNVVNPKHYFWSQKQSKLKTDI